MKEIEGTLSPLDRLLDTLENPAFALSYEEAFQFLMEIGVYFSHQLQTPLHENETVKEDPNSYDALGNVLMKHSRRVHFAHQLNEELGFAICELAHAYREKAKHLDDVAIGYNELFLGIWDDTSSEDILEAKRLIRRLRRENYSLDARNYRLSCIIAKQKLRLSRLELLNHRASTKSSRIDLHVSPSVPNLYFGSNGKHINLTRNENRVEHEDSQLDSLQW